MRSTKTRLGVGFITFVATARLAIGTAYADDDKVARAAVLSREAETLMSSGKTAEACNKLADSQTLDPRGGTLLDLALCREKEGRIGTAYTLFEAAEKTANAESRSDRATTARTHRNTLFAKVPRVIVNVPKDVVVEGIEVRAGLASDLRAQHVIPPSEWGKPYPVDPGDLRVTASAPAKATFEEKFNLKNGQKKAITVAALKAGSGPEARPGPDLGPPTSGDKTGGDKTGGDAGDKTGGDKSGGDKTGGDKTGGDKQPDVPSAPAVHEGGRVVVDLQAIAGGALSLILRAPVAELNGTQYIYLGAGGSEFLASCGNTSAVPGAGRCDATFNPQIGFLGGAQLFVGYAISDTFQLGGRGFFGASFPLGYTILGGPSFSVKAVGPLWLGFTAVVGTSQMEATVTGGRGSIPKSALAANPKGSDIDIPVENLAGGFSTGDQPAGAFGGFEVGGSVEISIELVDNPTNGAGSGALMLSAWPGGTWSPASGGTVFLPIGFGYRFY